MRNRRDGLSSQDVNATFSALSNEHASRRAELEREQTWLKIERRLGAADAADFRDFAERSTRRVWAMAGACAVAAAALLYFFLPSRLQYEVRGARINAGWIQARGEAAQVDFSDGSRVELHAGAALAVQVTGTHAARTRLAEGDLDISVKHAPSTDFRFVAGPYEVHVIGTKFHLLWRPETQLFSLAMSEGRVHVTGPNGLDRAVSAGETLRISGSEPRTAISARDADAAPRMDGRADGRAASNDADPSGSAIAARAAAAETTEPNDSKNGAPAIGHSDGPPTPTWSLLVAKGQFADVVATAESLGTERVLRERSSAEISALAHAAHYTGHSTLAVSAWSALRQRFGGQKAARQAAFFLGRVFDQQGRRADALHWLNTYLSEAPSDVYTSEALGRKLTLVQKLEGTLAARNVAREYIGRFPRGAYAQSARTILDED